MIVSAGIVNATDENEFGRVEMLVKMQDTVVHSEYNNKTIENDIALIHLPEDLKLNDYIQPAKLPKRMHPNAYDFRKAIVSGWGQTNHGPTDILKYLVVRIISNKHCEKLWSLALNGLRKLILNSFLCIDTRRGLPCFGDSGGPLVLDDGSDTIVGIVSHGYDAECNIRVPDIFTRVSSFVDWIEMHTGKLT